MKETQRETKDESEGYLPFVRKIASRMARRLPQSVDIEDLVGAGTVGLMEALSRFDNSGGRSFETYAEFRIKGAMLDELRRNDPLSRSARSAKGRIENKTAQLTAELGRPPQTEEVAAALNTSMERFVTKLTPLETFRTIPLDPESVQAEDQSMNQEVQLGQRETVAVVRQMLDKLSERQQMILNLYYIEELNQVQIGQILGVSESRICQILNETLKQLRQYARRLLE